MAYLKTGTVLLRAVWRSSPRHSVWCPWAGSTSSSPACLGLWLLIQSSLAQSPGREDEGRWTDSDTTNNTHRVHERISLFPGNITMIKQYTETYQILYTVYTTTLPNLFKTEKLKTYWKNLRKPGQGVNGISVDCSYSIINH